MNECPLPYEDDQVITSAHGSGGKMMHQLIETLIYKNLNNDLLATQHDGAVFNLEGPLAFSTDSFVISPIFFPGGNIGSLAVHGTVNDVAMCGAIPKYLSLSLVLEEGFRLSELEVILKSVSEAAKKAKVQVITGDTKVVERGKGDKIYINTSGVGQLHPKANIDGSRLKDGMAIIVSNHIASHGMAIMSERENLGLQSSIKSDSCSLNHVVEDLLDQLGNDVIMVRDATRGGLATVLNEWAMQYKLGVDIDADDIPVLDEVAGACEVLGIDPLYVANEGAFVMVVPSEKVEKAIEILHKHSECLGASSIGRITSEHPGKVVSKTSYGGRRVVAMLAGDPLPRIC